MSRSEMVVSRAVYIYTFAKMNIPASLMGKFVILIIREIINY